MSSHVEDDVIGYFGFPRRSILAAARRQYGDGLPLVDLDVNHGAPDAGIMPATTCRIIANIVDNAVHLGRRLIAVVAAVGEDKCDRGRHAAYLLRGIGFNVIESRFTPGEYEDRPLAYATCRGSLSERIQAIMDTVVDPTPPEAPPARSAPTHGFWGVPPNDFRVLAPFPSTTHIYGWTRCVEAGRPGDMDLECFVEEGVPTVFFTQSFCSKQDIARHLAARYDGLAIDCHREVNDSIMAKIEAFIRLS
jgi:hypothetical protein